MRGDYDLFTNNYVSTYSMGSRVIEKKIYRTCKKTLLDNPST